MPIEARDAPMPMIKDAAPPVSSEKLRALREVLSPDYGHQLVTDGGLPVLVVRVPSAKPDFLTDVDRAAEVITEEEVRACKDVLLLGTEKMVRVDPIPLRDKIRERAREEAPTAAEMRNQLSRQYGVDILRPQGVRGPAVVGVRVPRAKASEMTTEDRAALQPVVEDAVKQARDVTKVFVIADADFRTWSPTDFSRVLRGESIAPPPAAASTTIVAQNPGTSRGAAKSGGGFSGSPFGSLIGQAMETDQVLKAKKLAREGKTVPADALATAAPSPTPMTAAPAPLPPSLSNSPFGGLLRAAIAPPAKAPSAVKAEPSSATPEPALAPASAPAPPSAVDPLRAIAEKFAKAGYEFAPAATEVGFDLAAHKDGGKRLLVKKVATVDLILGKELAARADALGADAVVVIADDSTAETRAYALGTKLEIVSAKDVPGLDL